MKKYGCLLQVVFAVVCASYFLIKGTVAMKIDNNTAPFCVVAGVIFSATLLI